MTDFQYLLLILALLYLSECLLWIRRGSIAFRALAGGAFRPVNPAGSFGARGLGVVWLNPLPPFGTAFVSHQWPLSITPDAVCSFVPNVINGHDRPLQQPRQILFAAMQTLATDGATLSINGQPFARLHSETHALYFARLLEELRRSPPTARAHAIDRALARATNPRLIRRRLARFHQLGDPLAWHTHAVFLLLLGPVPAAIGVLQLRPWLLPSLAALAGMVLLTALGFYHAHRRLFPRLIGQRWRATLTLCAAPTIAIRARDLLARELLAEFHPVAVALVLCKPADQSALARRVLMDIRHPMQPALPADEAEMHATIRAFQQRLSEALEAALQQAGEDIAAICSPPPAAETASLGYCPRCDAQFIIAGGVCSNCGDLPTKPFALAGQTAG